MTTRTAGRGRGLPIAGLLFFIGCRLFGAQDMALPAPLQYQLFLKILKYDRNLTAKMQPEFVIGILYQSGFRNSEQAMEAFRKAVQATGQKEFPDVSIKPVPIDLDGEPDLEKTLVSGKVGLIYVAPLRGYDLKAITSLSHARKVITLTGVPEYAEKGLAVGVGLKGESPEIIINLPAAREEGSDFSSSLLKLARVIEQPQE